MLLSGLVLFGFTIYSNSSFAAVDVNITNEPVHVWIDNKRIHVWIDNQFDGSDPSVTCVYSYNNLRLKDNERYYNPKLEELDENIAPMVGETIKVGVVYDGYFDNNHKEVYKGNSASRALEILGYDFLLKSEGLVSKKYTNTKLKNVIDLKTAIMDLYKAYGKEILSYALVVENDPSFDIDDSPFMSMVTTQVNGPLMGDGWDTSRNSTYVYTTRTNPDLYWEAAVNDKIVVSGESSSALNVADFCVYAQRVMDLFGEPVLTQTESNYLMEIYGKDLPYNLTEVQLEAVKYLIVRGIALPSYDFSAPLTRDIFFDMLMRIKDVDSREVFKNIQFEYDESMLSKGYYPANVTTESSQLVIEEQEIVDLAAAENYTYFVKDISNVTTFDDCSLSQLVVSDNYLSPGVNSTVVGNYDGRVVIGGESWLQFSIRTDIETLCPEAVRNDKVCVYYSGTNYRFYLKLGGGWYYKHVNSPAHFKRSPFTEHDDLSYVDKERKTLAQKNSNMELSLDNSKVTTVTFKFYGDNYKNVQYDGISVSQSDKCVINKESQPIVITITDNNDFSTIKSKISFKAAKSASQVHQAFGQRNSEWVVSVDYLKSVGLIQSFTPVLGSKEVYRMVTEDGNVYINEDNHTIVVGQTIYEVEDDLILYYKDTDGVEYVNYRAAIGWTYEVFSIDAGNNTVSLVTKSTAPTSYSRESRGVYTLTGSTRVAKYAGVITTNPVTLWKTKQNKYISLASTYALANYMIYQATNTVEGTAMDYLFVFKLKSTVDDTDDSEAREVLKVRAGISAPDDWFVYCYPLRKDNKHKQSTQVKYVPGLGYLYKLQKIADLNDYYKYQKVLIPIVLGEHSKAMDINLNTFTVKGETLPIGTVPDIFCKRSLDYDSLKQVDVINAWSKKREQTVKSSGTISLGIDEIAPTGVISILTGMQDVSYEMFSNVKVFIGTMDVGIVNILKDDGKLELKSSGKLLYDNIKLSDTKFKLLRLSANKAVLSYADEKLSFKDPSIFQTIFDMTKVQGTEISRIDWDKYKFNTLINNVDNFLSIVLIFILNFLPRVGIWSMFALMFGCFLTDFKPWVHFCDRVFDPYKLLTLNRKDVHTIRIGYIFFSTMVGIGIFGLFYDGTILLLFQWFARAFSGIFTR